MSTINKVDLKNLFKDLQTNMAADLSLSRANIPHAPSKGDASEITWLKMFQKYLPKRYQAKKAFVVDSEGTISDQLDIVIFDQQYSPFLLNHNEALYIPAESVYCVFEVKQSISKNNVEYAGDKAASVRKLIRTSAPIVQAGGNIDNPKPPPRILAGFLSLESDWNPGLGDSCIDALKSQTGDQKLDFGCVINHGAFVVLEKTKGSLFVEVIPTEKALVSFFMALLKQLQSMGTVPAMEISAYTENL
jgi:uncharacterized protein DUF6602